MTRDTSLLNPRLHLATNAPSAAAGFGATLRVLNSDPVSATSLYEKSSAKAAPVAGLGRDGEAEFDTFVRVERSRHKPTNTIHVLASAIKKLQGGQRGAWDSIDGRMLMPEAQLRGVRRESFTQLASRPRAPQVSASVGFFMEDHVLNGKTGQYEKVRLSEGYAPNALDRAKDRWYKAGQYDDHAHELHGNVRQLGRIYASYVQAGYPSGRNCEKSVPQHSFIHTNYFAAARAPYY